MRLAGLEDTAFQQLKQKPIASSRISIIEVRIGIGIRIARRFCIGTRIFKPLLFQNVFRIASLLHNAMKSHWTEPCLQITSIASVTCCLNKSDKYEFLTRSEGKVFYYLYEKRLFSPGALNGPRQRLQHRYGVVTKPIHEHLVSNVLVDRAAIVG